MNTEVDQAMSNYTPKIATRRRSEHFIESMNPILHRVEREFFGAFGVWPASNILSQSAQTSCFSVIILVIRKGMLMRFLSTWIGLLLIALAGCDQGQPPAPKKDAAQPGAGRITAKQPEKGPTLIPVEYLLLPGKNIDVNGVKIEVSQLQHYKGDSLPEHFQVQLNLSNVTPAEVLYFDPQQFLAKASVRDEFGNRYALAADGDIKNKRRCDPEKRIDARIRFDVPQAACKEVTIVFRGECVGRPGAAVICRIPREEFKETRDEIKKKSKVREGFKRKRP